MASERILHLIFTGGHSLRGDTVLVGPDGANEDLALDSAFLSYSQDILRAIFLNGFHLFWRGNKQSNH